MDLDKFIFLKPYSFDSYYQRGLAYHQFKNHHRDLSDYTHSLKNFKDLSDARDRIEILKNIGLIIYELGSTDEALKRFKIAYREDNKDSELNFAVAVALYSKGERQKSYELAKDVLSSEKRYSNISFLKQKLWGEEIIDDAKILLSMPEIQKLTR
jgi:tetratricopeptide (TPR) repeat protein